MTIFFLSGLLRDIQARPLDLLHHRAQDNERLALFPNLDYLGLHQALVALVDVMPLIQSGTQGRIFRGYNVYWNNVGRVTQTWLNSCKLLLSKCISVNILVDYDFQNVYALFPWVPMLWKELLITGHDNRKLYHQYLITDNWKPYQR